MSLPFFNQPTPQPTPSVVYVPPPPAEAGNPADTPPAEPKVSREDPAVVAAREAEAAQIRRRAGRASTILTGPMGDTSAAPVTRKVLLGG